MDAPSNVNCNWPRWMIGTLTQAEPNWLASSAIQWNIHRKKSKAPARSRYGSGMHCHDYWEICFLVHGAGTMEIQDQQFSMQHSSLIVLPPGVMHCESYDAQRHPYATVWLSFKENGARVFANAYDPKEGWSCPWSSALPAQDHLLLNKNLLENPPRDKPAFETFRTELVVAIARLMRQEHLHPDQGQVAPGHRRVLRWVKNYLDQYHAQPLSVKSIAAKTRYSPHYLDSIFSKWAGKGIRAYMIEQRLSSAMALCQQTQLPIHQIAQRVGYEDAFYFSRAFKKYHGRSPSQVRIDALSS